RDSRRNVRHKIFLRGIDSSDFTARRRSPSKQIPSSRFICERFDDSVLHTSAPSTLNFRVAALARVRETRVLANAATLISRCDGPLARRASEGRSLSGLAYASGWCAQKE